MEDYSNWPGWERPQRKVLEGRYARLEPIDDQHLDGLLEIVSGEGAAERMKYIWESPMNREELQEWINMVKNSTKRICFAIIDKKSGKVGGKHAFIRIKEAHGTAEIGHVLYGPVISRKPAATEAVYLFAKHLFEDLGYRRFEWKCHGENLASKKAALRFGFKLEGVFRQHLVMKGKPRDSIWLAMIKEDWPEVKEAFENWLDPLNFDENGIQKKKLENFRKGTVF